MATSLKARKGLVTRQFNALADLVKKYSRLAEEVVFPGATDMTKLINEMNAAQVHVRALQASLEKATLAFAEIVDSLEIPLGSEEEGKDIQRRVLERKVTLPSEESWNLKLLMDSLDTVIRQEQEIERYVPAKTEHKAEAKQKPGVTQDMKRTPFCFYCESKDHWSTSCTKLKHPNERIDFLKTTHRCLGCARTTAVQESNLGPSPTILAVSESPMKTIREQIFLVTGHAVKPKILVGCDQLWDFINFEASHFNLPSGLTLIPTKFGYSVSGRKTSEGTTSPTPTVVNMLQLEDKNDQWEQHWNLQINDVGPDYTGPGEGKKRHERCTTTCQTTELWRREGSHVYCRKTKKEQENILQQYDDVFKEQIRKGILEEVNESEDTSTTKRHYQQVVPLPRRTEISIQNVHWHANALAVIHKWRELR
ncbi:hypothetical protein OSTOST_19463 [Ostertagia ostertagi]